MSTSFVSQSNPVDHQTILVTSDEKEITVPPHFVAQFQTIKDIVCDIGGGLIPVQVDSETILKFIEYSDKHKNCKEIAPADKTEEDRAAEKEMKAWDETWADFKTEDGKLDYQRYIKYAKASNFLANKNLTKLFGQKMVKAIRGKTPEEIRIMSGICTTCHRSKCVNETEKTSVDKFTGDQVVEKERCQTCEACVVVKCPHDKFYISFTEEEEKKILQVKPYEEWKKEMDARQQKSSTQ